jgi:hypothetical protein
MRVMSSTEQALPSDGNNMERTRLSSEYLRLIELVESLPENQTGSDKTWVEVHLRESKEHFEKARRIR